MQDSKKITVIPSKKIDLNFIRSLFKFIKLNWPAAFRWINQNDMQKIMNCWLHLLKDYDVSLIRDAAYECLKTCRYAPQLVDIFEAIKKIEKDQKNQVSEENFVVAEDIKSEEELQKELKEIEEWSSKL